MNCPQRYEDGFVEPEGGLPYGSWMRVADLKDMGNSSPGLPLASQTRNRVLSASAVPRTGFWVSEDGVRGYGLGAGTETVNPTIAWGASHRARATLSSFSSSSLETPDANGVVSERRRVKVVSNKRKAKEAALVLPETAGKKLQLKLRDEEIDSTAETAEQSRRTK